MLNMLIIYVTNMFLLNSDVLIFYSKIIYIS